MYTNYNQSIFIILIAPVDLYLIYLRLRDLYFNNFVLKYALLIFTIKIN